MPLFRYIAKTRDAQTVRETIDAPSREELARRLKSKGLFVVTITGARSRKPLFSLGGLGGKSRANRGKHRKVKSLDMCFFARNLAITLSSGVPLLRSLEIISIQTESLNFSDILKKISIDIKAGLSLSDAVAKHPKVFPPLWTGIMEVGEASGNLPFVLEKLADYLEMRYEFERKVKGALIYPMMVSIFAAVAVTIFFKFILPRFTTIFETFDIELPLLTQIIFNMSNFFNHHFIWIVLGSVGIVFGFRYLKTQSWFREILDKISLTAPITGKLALISVLERFCSTMYILLESGVPMVYSLDVISKSVGNSVAQKHITNAKDSVKRGKSLSSELDKVTLFPPLVAEIARIGEEAGNMPQMFQKISTHYQKELSSQMDKLISMFEPLVIFLLGISIGTIVIALFLPIFKLVTMSGA